MGQTLSTNVNSDRRTDYRFGQWEKFKDFADAMADLYNPYKVSIYPEFAVFDFTYSVNAFNSVELLADRIAERYPAVRVETDRYMVALIAVAEESDDDAK